jgi:hypothetical protein
MATGCIDYCRGVSLHLAAAFRVSRITPDTLVDIGNCTATHRPHARVAMTDFQSAETRCRTAFFKD